MREDTRVPLVCYSSPYTVKPNYWFYSRLEDSSSPPPPRPGRAADQLGKFLPSCDGSEGARASAVPSELLSMCAEGAVHCGSCWRAEAVMNQQDGAPEHVCCRAAPCSSSGPMSTWRLQTGWRNISASTSLIHGVWTHLHITWRRLIRCISKRLDIYNKGEREGTDGREENVKHKYERMEGWLEGGRESKTRWSPRDRQPEY